MIRWKIKSATNEELRDRFVQKFVPLLHDYGFVVPDPGLHRDRDGRWALGTIDWSALGATQRNVGPDSQARVDQSRSAWEDTEWVRTALDVDSMATGSAR